MAYTITYTHAYNRASERWDGSLDEAQTQAIAGVLSGAADYVEISDSGGKIIDTYPACSVSRKQA